MALYCVTYITTLVCVHRILVFYLLRTGVYPSTPITKVTRSIPLSDPPQLCTAPKIPDPPCGKAVPPKLIMINPY